MLCIEIQIETKSPTWTTADGHINFKLH